MSFQPTEKDMFDTHNCQPSGIHLSALPSVIEKSTDEESMLIFELSKKKFHLKKISSFSLSRDPFSEPKLRK